MSIINKGIVILFLLRFVLMPYFIIPNYPPFWHGNTIYKSADEKTRVIIRTPVYMTEPEGWEGRGENYQAKCDNFFVDMCIVNCNEERFADEYMQTSAEEVSQENLSRRFGLQDLFLKEQNESIDNGIQKKLYLLSGKKDGNTYEIRLVNMRVFDKVCMVTYIYYLDDSKGREFVEESIKSIEVIKK